MTSQDNKDSNEPIIENIILDDSAAFILSENGVETSLFSSLKAEAKPIKSYKLEPSNVEYTQLFSGKCAICNSPHRKLLENVYIDSGKKINAVVNFFEEYYAAKLNWAQVKQHIKYHCDFTAVDKPGIVDYDGEDEMVSRWKYREYELALTAMLVELSDVRGIQARTPDEILRRSVQIEKITKQILFIKEKRDDNVLGLPNVFEVLYDLHNMMKDEDDKRIIREKVRDLKQAIS